MRTPSSSVILWVLAAALVGGCKKDEKKEDAKPTKAEPEDEGEPTLQVAVGDEDVPGPVPPDTSMVFYTVEGALLPLACFDQKAGEIKTGKPCLAMVESGTEVRVTSTDTSVNKPVGEPTEPQCLAGEGKEIALAVEGITEGANFKYGAWPPSALKVVKYVPDSSTRPENTQLGEDETSTLMAAVQKAGGKGDELKAHQIAEIDVDANDTKDKVYAVFIPHPKLSEQYAWSGTFVAMDGDLENLVLVEKSQSKKDVFEVKGTLDLDGDGSRELWVRLVFEEGGGDRIYRMTDGKAEPIGKWSCGAA